MSTATTVGDLVQQTRRHLFGMSRGQLNKLTSGIDDSVTTLSYTYDTTIAVNAYVAIDDELLFVWAVDESNRALTVARAQLGTVAASHATDAMIEVSPRFPLPTIRDALQDEITSWPNGVYATFSETYSVGSNTLALDLVGVPSNYYDILDVVKKPTTSSTISANDPFSTSWKQVGFRPQRDMDTAEFSSGTALFLNETASGGYMVRVSYAAPFDVTTFTDATTLAAIGLEPSMVDIPPYGAVWRLLSGREVFRTALEAQGENRNAQEVPVGQTIRAASAFEGFRNQRLAEESIRLLNRHSWRRTA